MVYQQLIGKYKSIRKKKLLGKLPEYEKNYAFIGVGEHSMANLYPVLHHLKLPLKYIYSRTRENANAIAAGFSGSEATTDLGKIMTDESVDAVFICLKPSEHFSVAQQALAAGKHVFVEKPPCRSLQEIEQLIAGAGNLICQPGLQRRTSTLNTLIHKNKLLDGAISYRYSFQCGLYPEGDVFTELFIHPADYLLNLFGEYKKISVQNSKQGGGITCQVQLLHESGVQGQLELSTHYSWQQLRETIEINTIANTVSASYPNSLATVSKSALLGLPLEKIISKPTLTKTYLDPFALTTGLESNSVVLQGFAGGITEFVEMCESGKINQKLMMSTMPRTYRMLEAIRQG